MTWFAAHVIICFKYKNGEQIKFPVYENVYLLQAESDAEAWKKAEMLGKREEGDDDGSLKSDGRPATRFFAGVRKLTTLIEDEGPRDGVEITYSELEVDSEQALTDLAKGNAVKVKYEDVTSA